MGEDSTQSRILLHANIIGVDELQQTNSTKEVFRRIVSDSDRGIYMAVNFFTICSIISAFGVVANVMNIIVFYKQGFSNTMNISFFGLAISDLCSLLVIFWFNICLSGVLIEAGLPMSPGEVMHLTAGFPHICFSRITCWITVFITAERCLCITLPLRVKEIITPRRTKIIIITIYILVTLSFEPEYQISYIGWRFDTNRNRTILGLIFRSNAEKLQGVALFLYAVLGSASFVAIISFTLLLVYQLNKKSKWRRTASVEKSRAETISNKERKTITMVAMIATVLIVCYTPGVAVSSVPFFEPEFNICGSQLNAFVSSWSFVFVFETFNSSVNIFLYYFMSTKYRDTFRLVFCAVKAVPSV